MRWVVALAAVLVVLVPLGAGSAAAADDRQVSGGTFEWGVKESFRNYVAGHIAGGRITPGDGASQAEDNGVFTFAKGAGTVRGSGGAVFSFTGSVHFYGHGGDLDVTLADPKINVNANGNGYLEITETRDGKDRTVQIATVREAKVSTSGDNATLRGAKTELTRAGMAVFSMDGTSGASFYSEGDALDPASAEVELTAATPDPDPTDPDPTDPDPTDPGPTDPGPTDPPPSDPEPNDPSPKPTPKPTDPKPTTPTTPATGTSGTLRWGVKSSFRSYVGGPVARGKVTTSGHAATSNGVYVFPQRSTSAKPPSPSGTTTYRGQVTFYGHHGDLNMDLRNPRVVVTSGSRGKLVVDSRPTGASGFRAVTVSNLNLTQGSKSTRSGSVTYRNVPVTLSSAGTKLFAWEGRSMYPAGTAMDPVTFTIGADKKVSGSGKSTTSTPRGSGTGGSAGTGGGAGGADTGTSAASGSGSASSAAAAASRTGAGSLTWGLRKSFRDYITGPIAHGSISVSGGASSSGAAFTFPQSGGAKGDGGAGYRGAVTFRGHGGILDISFADPAVSIDSTRSGSLSAQVDGRRITVATLNLGAAAKSESGGATAYTNVPATLTSQGSTLFRYNGDSFYPAGTAMDSVSFTVGSAAAASAGGGASASPQTVASADAGGPGGGTTALDPDAAAADEVKASKEACKATGSDLTWGFKESFRSYVSGSIAKGDWATEGGATYSTPTFEWAKGKGTFDEKTRTGAVEFPGTIAFSGHDGALNTTISDPEVRLEGDRALIVLDSEGATMDAAMEGRDDTKAYPNVPFVAVDLSDAKVETKDGTTTITATEAPTTLTEQGESAFSNYTAGTEFDPISFTIMADSSCIAPDKVTDPQAKDAAAAAPAPTDGGSSGDDGFEIPMWAAWTCGGLAGAALAASGTVLLMRRRLTAGAAA